jgi:hypothetical protein
MGDRGDEGPLSLKESVGAWLGSSVIALLIVWFGTERIEEGGFWGVVLGIMLLCFALGATTSLWTFVDAVVRRFGSPLTLGFGAVLILVGICLSALSGGPETAIGRLGYVIAVFGGLAIAKSCWPWRSAHS